MLARPLALVLALSAVALAAPARAQTEDAQTDEAPPAYEAAVDEAVDAFQGGRWEEARSAFRRAHAISPNARTLRGVGMAAFELSAYLEAAEALEAALAEPRRALTERQRAHASDLLARARSHLGAVVIPPAPVGAELLVDGAPRSAEGWPEDAARLTLPEGAHTIGIRVEDREAHAELELAGGSEQPVDIDLAPLAEPVAPPPVVVAARPPLEPTPPPPTDDGSAATAGWAVFGAGLGVAAVGAILLGVGAADASAVQGAAPGTEWSTLEAQYDRAPALMGAGGAMLGVGAVSAIVGVVLALAGGGDDDARVQLRGNELRVAF
ncbi:MAG: hypothetical protein H6719_22950 [Sandaracinaceae bacterium]|nr:hypothetical protein [Sandaracinaceae bacterium]